MASFAFSYNPSFVPSPSFRLSSSASFSPLIPLLAPSSQGKIFPFRRFSKISCVGEFGTLFGVYNEPPYSSLIFPSFMQGNGGSGAAAVAEVNLRKDKVDLLSTADAEYAAPGKIAIGFQGDSSLQPFISPDRSMGIVFCGRIVNYYELREPLEAEGFVFSTEYDAELVSHLITKQKRLELPLAKIIAEISEKLMGAHSMIVISAAEKSLVAVSDPMGFWPLYAAVSSDRRSCVLSSVPNGVLCFDIRTESAIPPGQVLLCSDDSVREYSGPILAEEKRQCMYKHVYLDQILGKKGAFGGPFDRNFLIEGIASSLAEKSEGAFGGPFDRNLMIEGIASSLAEKSVEADAVVFINDSAEELALSYAFHSDVHFFGGIFSSGFTSIKLVTYWKMKSFMGMMNGGLLEVRAWTLRGKRVVIVDDCPFLCATSTRVVALLKEKIGVKEVHLRVGCPEISASCPYGIDFPDKVEYKLDAYDSVKFVSMDAIKSIIGSEFCTECFFPGEY